MILAAFGQTPAAIHFGLFLVNAATIGLIYLLGLRLFGRLAGLVAAASYALLSVSPAVLGLAGHATHFVVLPAVGGILLLLTAMDAQRLRLFFSSGLLFGLAFLMKQPGIFFLLFAVLYLLKTEWKPPVDWRSLAARMGCLLLGSALPLALTCVVLYASGVFQSFWFWTFSYAWQYAARVGLADGFHVFNAMIPRIVHPAIFIWIIAGIGFTAIFWNRELRAYATFIYGLVVFSCLAVCPGLYFRQHYFILMLPGVALLTGIAVSSAVQVLRRNPSTAGLAVVPVFLFLGASLASVVQQRVLLFEMNATEACRAIYFANPFPEALPISNYLAAHMPSEGRIAILGSEPEIYFYSRRHSASGYIYVYPLVEGQKYALTMQKDMIGEIESAVPEFLVFVQVPESWLVTETSETHSFLSWADDYIRSHYELVGIADIIDPRHTEYRWGDQARTYRRRSRSVVLVFRRNR